MLQQMEFNLNNNNSYSAACERVCLCWTRVDDCVVYTIFVVTICMTNICVLLLDSWFLLHSQIVQLALEVRAFVYFLLLDYVRRSGVAQHTRIMHTYITPTNNSRTE